jgi:hypothetical protein
MDDDYNADSEFDGTAALLNTLEGMLGFAERSENMREMNQVLSAQVDTLKQGQRNGKRARMEVDLEERPVRRATRGMYMTLTAWKHRTD